MKITASDRSNLIRLASSLPRGSETRKSILSGLSKVGMEFDTKEALGNYLKDHPGADKSLHSVKKDKKDKSEKEEKGPGHKALAKRKDISSMEKKLQDFKVKLEKGGLVSQVRLRKDEHKPFKDGRGALSFKFDLTGDLDPEDVKKQLDELSKDFPTPPSDNEKTSWTSWGGSIKTYQYGINYDFK